ncbi:aminopeptidase P family protein [Halodesulfovibrio marinisediminis]|uniref:Xaa-Pro aminopeptidase n=1 Tax=Halodesulfovibrio marinisediminis DSM 17456 TaxID=1121457 RepID=A0A1N6H6P4_9BACT|nr:aminopeptidase P family protein [Halodesulfovibrio marinisediminis]SIO15365.1 Xaa-Pro aminopeptidase [Halodesulfovibrio marinisediminis DSM 17456]
MFSAATYAERRKALCARLTERGEKGLLLFPGHASSPMNYTDNAYPFRQDSSFLYFFGHDHEGLTGVINLDAGESWYFDQGFSMDDIIWSGATATPEELAARCGAEKYGEEKTLVQMIADAKKTQRPIHILPVYRADSRMRLVQLLDCGVMEVDTFVSTPFIKEVVALRSIKSIEEVMEIEQALETSYAMYANALSATRPGASERQIASILHSTLALAGSTASFTPICTGRGQILHNHEYSHILHSGDMLLIDSGAESENHYASDITRTFPVSGTFTDQQRAVYTIVLAAQEAAISKCAPDVPFIDCHMTAAKIIASGLRDLGVLKGNVDDIVDAGAHALFFPHGLGHMLGLDVHDMEGLGEDFVGYDSTITRSEKFGLRGLRLARKLQRGFVVTVEPGCYFISALMEQWEAEGTCKEFINFDTAKQFSEFGGIRIEDNVYISRDGHRVLGQQIPKTIAGIEGRMHASSQRLFQCN